MQKVSDLHTDTKRFNLLITVQPDGIGWRYEIHCVSSPENTFSVYDAWMKRYVIDVWYQTPTDAVDAAIDVISGLSFPVAG